MPTHQWIAEHDVICISADSRSDKIHLRVAAPVRASDGDWLCTVAADGLISDIAPIHGVDSWQALIIGMRLLRQLLESKAEQGSTYYWPTDSSPITMKRIFSETEDEAPNEDAMS